MAERRRRRRRGSRRAPRADTPQPDTPETPTLPAVPGFSPDAVPSADDARAALDAVTDQTDTTVPTDADEHSSGVTAPDGGTAARPDGQQADPSTPAKNPPAGRENVRPAGQASDVKPSPVRPRRLLSAKRYEGMKREQLQGALAVAEERVERLEAQLAQAAPVAQAASNDALKFACGATAGVAFDVAALLTGVDDVRLSSAQVTKLGDAWAVALAPYLQQYAAQLPIMAAVGVTLEIGTEKYFAYRAAKGESAVPRLSVVRDA